ncbi:hypothetical protein GcM1_241067 [Golovinomyces cichoracearum]|uniref:Rrn9 domain-containing protein n=1 Tax=Golovinomyces cichoracearum TaxID=62708 RepID=A0A420IHR7_9PEZI|nr:hypothetical protein GcM1_241067 [Golovinomyces cichoracearum]
MSQSEASDDEFSSYSDDRPNRHIGAAKKWLSYTEKERGEYASLVQAKNQDLSIHLYNAYVLRQRAKEYQDDPQSAKINTEYSNLPENQRTFKPPNKWTAWPLPPDHVPRPTDNDIKEDGFDMYTLRKKESDRPSRELEEVLLGITLKLARKMFEQRESENDKAMTKDINKPIYTSSTDNEAERDDVEKKLSMSPETYIRKPLFLKQSEDVFLEPVFSCEDENLRQLLRPSIRHILVKINQVLTGLHESRKACYSHASLESKRAFPRQLKRSRDKTLTLVVPPQNIRVIANQNEEQNDLLQVKKSRLGRPPKVYERLDGENEQDFLVRIARKKKKAIPVFKTTREPEKPAKKNPELPVKKLKKPSRDRVLRRQNKIGLRDWSEIIGIAALIGISEDVITKTTRRCVNLFDESILINSMTEAHFKDQDADSTICYRASHDSCTLSEDATNESESQTSDFHARNSNYSSSRISLPKRKLSTKQAFFCPITRCPRRLQGFKDQNALNRHLSKGHRIERKLIEDHNLLPNHEDLDGAIHTDGFLRCLRTQKYTK